MDPFFSSFLDHRFNFESLITVVFWIGETCKCLLEQEFSSCLPPSPLPLPGEDVDLGVGNRV